METLLEVTLGRFEIRRAPFRKNDLLRAWDAADEYLLNHLAAQENLGSDSSLTILNDSFGALSVALNAYQPTALSDSYLSQQATRTNLDLNGISRDSVRLLDSLVVPDAGIDYLLIKVPKTLGLLEYQLHSLRPLLKPNVKIIAAGMVKNLPSSVWKLLERLIGPATTSLAVKKARLIFAALDPAIKLPNNPYPVCYPLENTRFLVCNHANVFSRDSLDIGTRFLLQHLPDYSAYRDFIDLGCGNGVVGLMLADRHPDANLCFVDESFMAIASARENFQSAFGGERQARFAVNDGLDGFPDRSADCVVCNPPFHQQHTVGGHIAWQMFRKAHQVLRKGGELRVIGNRHLNYHLSLKKLFGHCEQVASNAKFVIFSCIKR
ncbi:MAG: methyltransferase [Methylococcaceae bacterium]|nr:methyltransferase [Methylococcaceae bacterium]